MSRQVFSGKSNAVATNNVWLSLFGFGSFQADALAALATVNVRVATTVSNLYIELDTAPGSGAGYTYTLYKNGSATAITFTIADLATTGQDSANTVAYSVGDTITLRRVVSAGSPAAAVHYVSWQSDASNASQSLYGINNHTNTLTGGAARYNGLFAGNNEWNATQATPQNVVGCAGNLTGYHVQLNAGPGGGKTITTAVYKNDIKQDGTGGTVDTTGSATGATDAITATFTLPLVAGDRVVLESLPAGTPADYSAQIGSSFTATTAGESNVCGRTSEALSTTATEYAAFAGFSTNELAESTVQKIGGLSPFRLKGLYVVHDVAPAGVSAYTYDLRLNGATVAGAPSATISGASTIGTDATGEIEIPGVSDLINLRIVPTPTPAAPFFTWWAFAQVEPGDPLQKITQLAIIVGTDEYADEDPPPETDPCTGGGTVATGANPTDGTSIATATALHAVFRVTVNSVTYDFAQTAINHGTAKTPRVDQFGALRRALPDDKGGIELPSMSIDFFDHDNLLRGWHQTQTLHGLTAQVLVADEATWRAGGANAKVGFSGVIRDFRPTPGFRYTIELEDPLTLAFSATAQEVLIPRDLIDVNDGTSDQGLRESPFPALYGSLEEDGGAIPLPFIGTQTPIGHAGFGNRHRHLFCRGAIHNIRAIFRADPLSGDPPTERSECLTSEYVNDFLAPHISPNWYEPTDYLVVDDNRLTIVDVEQTHPAANLARYNRIPLTANVCGRETVGDGSGNVINSAPRVVLHVLNNEWAQTIGDADWAAMATRDSLSMFDTVSFETVKTVSEDRIAGGYKAAFILGHSYKQITLRDFIEQVSISFDMELFINRFGQVAATMLDRTGDWSSAPHDTAVFDIQLDSFSIDPRTDSVENVTRYVYRRKYVKPMQQLDEPEGTRLPREPFDADWISGLQGVSNSTSITALGGSPRGERASEVLEMELVRDVLTATDVAQQRNALRSPANGRAEATYTIQMQKADNVELGDKRLVTHPQGLGTGGWVAQRVQVRAIEYNFNANAMTATLTVRDVDDLLDVDPVDGLTLNGDAITLDGDPIILG